MKYLVVISIIFTLPPNAVTEIYVLSDEFIDSVNTNQSTWKAGRNFPENTPMEELKGLCGAYPIDVIPDLKRTWKFDHDDIEIPESFDSRIEWPNCLSLKQIRNQGKCGTCWALASASAMSDRICISTNGDVKFQVSFEDILTCCTNCYFGSNGCEGGNALLAWKYWMTDGVVSGGDYETGEGCKPFSKSAFANKKSETCHRSCENKHYSTSYDSDRHYGNSTYVIGPGVREIQLEIMENGPVVGFIRIYEDFFVYTSGVYVHKSGKYTDTLHAVKILGWGVDDKLSYWLIANSWGVAWGREKGFMKILRGVNHCGIEEVAIAGIAASSSIHLSLYCFIVFIFFLFL